MYLAARSNSTSAVIAKSAAKVSDVSAVHMNNVIAPVSLPLKKVLFPDGLLEDKFQYNEVLAAFIALIKSARTIRRRLQQSGLTVRHPFLRLPLRQYHRRLRRQ
ncbi:hypothetical protein LAZ67_23000958 [Cordylochernes scorpioides]|uniref:Uncharacterized protein n=1 Tax=Cordylochernes scorpioides TaxID=51811 RepID=A0ABY6LSU1_9ARAC|nr:hypothetical protein LAZ67_23000958 [Cordylochernes scorpioides]